VKARLNEGEIEARLSPNEVSVFCKVFGDWLTHERAEYNASLQAGTIDSGTKGEELIETAESMLEDMEAMDSLVNSDEDDSDDEEC
jgi:hypothetical protein